MGKPILMLGPEDSDAADLLNGLSTGFISSFEDKPKIKQLIKEAFLAYKNGAVKQQAYDMEMFSRRKLTGDLAVLLDNL
jgi:hypothetical protein